LAVDRSTGAEPAVEVAHAADAADDGVDVEVVEAEVALACVAEWTHDVVEIQQLVSWLGQRRSLRMSRDHVCRRRIRVKSCAASAIR
jgi:hypothetical protein